ncbi:zinc finger protein OZF-like isoform X2 [Toxorhynchites rutilus septentrionalis]|uniref:zinc finger protein OZF-like isoform X2 n=1 Tax=Toxorhynchites rutilus septentrionalis TaxID=329112 RepID=UPI002478444C|nr:zinc finger protein OZF-like isoform X2 [Toxorhynchites rutilus septentrionalis]
MNAAEIQEKFDHLCRFCLSEKECIFIFNAEHELNERLFKFIDIILTKVDDADGFPNNVCSKCVDCMEKIQDFEATCLKSYNILENAKISSKKFGSGTIEEGTEHGKHQNECLLDEAISDMKNAETVYAEEEINVERLEDEDSELIFDEDTVQPDIHDVKSELQSTSQNLSVEQQRMLDAAMETRPSKFIERNGRRVPLIECTYCKNVYRGRNTLKKHLRIHLGIKDYQCNYCPRTFTDRSSLRIHQGRHVGKSFKCPHCSKSYFSQNELRQHLTMQHLERRYVCDVCQRRFPSRTILNDHSRVHLPDRPFVCKQCGAGFKRNRNLLRHQLLHQKTGTENQHSWTCPLCSATKSSPTILLNHLKQNHCDEFETLSTENHRCMKCITSAFADFREYLVHQQTHYPPSTECKFYSCTDCDKKFKCKSSATKHLLKHSGIGSFICEKDDCGKMFKDESEYDRHQQQNHSNR